MGSLSVFYGCLGSLFIWLLFSAVVFAYERRLVPLYGGVPTNLYIIRLILAIITAAAITPVDIIRAITPNPLASGHWFIFAAPLLSVMPTATYWIGLYTGRLEDPWLGPIATHFIVLLPIGYIFSVSSMGLSLPVSVSANVNRFTS
jgi:hypothetical protein